MMQAFDTVRRQALRLFGVRLDDGYGILGVTLVDQTGAPVTISGGGGGGAVTVADGADVTQGTKADSAATDSTSSWTVVSMLKGIWAKLAALATVFTAGAHATAASPTVNIATDDAQFGTEYTGFAQETGGTGLRGAVSAIAKAVRTLVSTPSAQKDTVTSGNITALNANLTTGAPTAGSSLTLSGLNANATSWFYITGTFSATLVFQVSYDGTNWTTIPFYATNGPTAGSVTSIASGGGFVAMAGPIPNIRVSCSAYTSGTAVVTLISSTASVPSNVAMQYVNANLVSAGSGSMQINTATGGGSGTSLVVGITSSNTQTAYSAVSVVTSAKTGLATITETGGVGTVCSFFVNLTAFAAGSSTGLDLFLQWSPDGATNWIDLLQVEPFTAAGTAYIPPTYIPGRWRFAYQNRTGAATTATLTITATRLSLTVKPWAQWFDFTSGVLSGTASAVTPGYATNGCSNIAAGITLGAATTPGTYQLQVCSFNSATDTDWANVGQSTGTGAAVANATTRLFASGVTERFYRLKCTGAATAQTGTRVALSGS